MFSIFKKNSNEAQLRKNLFDFLAEMEKNMELFYVMDQRQFITSGFLTDIWPIVKDIDLIKKHETIAIYARTMEDFNLALKSHKEFETWYTSDINNKTPENARKLHALKNVLDEKLKSIEAVIILAGQDLEQGNVATWVIKSMSDEILTVSELNHFIRDVLCSGFPQAVWVCGEIQGYDRGKDKKHVFFELCEKDSTTREITARIGLVIFAQVRPKIDAILKKSENAFELKDDIEVKFLCKVDFYPGHGQVRLIVESIDPIHTLGKIAQDRQRLISVLKQKGLLDKNKQLELPDVVLKVGFITSFDSAAYHDFISELKRSGYGFKIFLINSIMQGKNTENSIIKALKSFEISKEVDVIVITRGGGSIAELSCFDSEKIAISIAQLGIPVLSGIGHEINTTVTDLAAHTFAKTPTAIAKFLVERLKNFIETVEDRQERLTESLRQLILKKRSKLKDNAYFLQTQTIGLIKNHHQRLASITEAIKRTPSVRFKESKKSLNNTREHLKRIIYLHLQNSRTKINHYQKLIQMADPANTLKRGFSITRTHGGLLIRSVCDVKNIKEITTQLEDGIINSTVLPHSERREES